MHFYLNACHLRHCCCCRCHCSRFSSTCIFVYVQSLKIPNSSFCHELFFSANASQLFRLLLIIFLSLMLFASLFLLFLSHSISLIRYTCINGLNTIFLLLVWIPSLLVVRVNIFKRFFFVLNMKSCQYCYRYVTQFIDFF